MIDTKDALIDAEIDQVIENQQVGEKQKEQKLSILKSSKLMGTDSSPQTIVSVANTMIGSAIILYPVLFVEDGIIGSTLIMFIVGMIQYLTCRLLVIHNRPNQPTYNQSILRIGGIKLDKINSITNALLLFFAGSGYFLLICTNFYQISAAIISAIDEQYQAPDINTINFGKYSIQWACIICIFLCLPSILNKKIQKNLALMKYSIYPIILYGIFILACVIKVVSLGEFNFGDYVKFDPNFSNVAGAFALSFLIHPTAAPILKRNVKLQNNERDLLFGYVLTALIYFYVGFLGGIGCANQVKNINEHPQKYSNVFDCVATHTNTTDSIFYVVGKFVQLGILFQNYAVLPVIFFIVRKQTIALTKKPQIFVGYSIFFLVVSSLFGILAVNVSIVLSFTGAVIGFIMVYLIPIYIHLKCHHYRFSQSQNKKRRSLLSSSTDFESQILQIDNQTEAELLQCNKHKKKNKIIHFIFYSLIICVGIALGIFKISALFA